MDIRWFKGIPDEEHDGREKEVKSFIRAFEELSQLLEERTSVPDYDCPSWSHKQADQNGYNRAIREIKQLINVKD